MSNNNKTPAIRFKGFTDDWEQRKVGDTYNVTRGYVLAAPKTSPIKTNEKPYPVYSSQTKDNGLMGYYNEYLYENAVTWTTDGANAGTVNFRAGKFYCTNVCGVLLSDLGYSNKAAAEALNMVAWKWVSHVGNPKLMNNVMAEIEISLPPTIQEQEKISEFLTSLDNLITLHQRKCDKLIQFKAGMLQKMFPQNGANKPEIRFRGFTDAWVQRKFAELTEIKSAARVHKGEWETSGVPFYRSSDVMSALNGTENEKAFISEELYEKLAAVSGKLEKGDVLITGGGSVGKPYIVPNNDPLYTKDADLLWIKKTKKLDPYFLYTFFFTSCFRDYLTSVSHVGTIAHYTITQLGETLITLPCISEQQKIGDNFRNLDNLIALHQHLCDKYTSIKSALIRKLFPST